MSEAPKKIWVDWPKEPFSPPLICSIKPDVHSWNGETYIRADLVDELIEALEYCIKQIPEFADVPGIKAALAKARGEL